jgi:hypothetical protein
MAKGDVALRDKDNLPAVDTNAALFAEYAGTGMETVGAQDVSIPRFKILQDLSPEVSKRKAEYIEGAEPGLILNTATKELFKSIHVLPCVYRRHHIEWLPNRGGFVADHGEDDSLLKRCEQDDKKNMILPNGNLIVPTATWYVIDLGSGNRAIIPMSRTQMNPSKDWMNLATSEKLQGPNGRFIPPLFYRGYTLGTRVRDKGENSWSVWNVERGDVITELATSLGIPDLMQQALEFARLVRAGEVKVGADAFADEDGGGRQEEKDDGTI